MQPSSVMKGCRTILLARHGETEANKEHRVQGRLVNFGLTSHGQDQISRLAHFLNTKELRPDVIIASSLVRAQESAHIIARILFGTTHAIETCEELSEIDFGNAQNTTLDSLWGQRVNAADYYAGLDINISYPGGESIRDAQHRIVKSFLDTTERYKDQKPLIVSHGGVLRLLMAWILKTDHIQPIYHHNAGLTIVDQLEERYAIRTLNSTGHLTDWMTRSPDMVL